MLQSEELGTWDGHPAFSTWLVLFSSTFVPEVPGQPSKGLGACPERTQLVRLRYAQGAEGMLRDCHGAYPFGSGYLHLLPSAPSLAPYGYSPSILDAGAQSSLALSTLPGTLAAPLRLPEKDVNEGVWPGSVNKPARELRLAAIRRKDDVMQRRGVSRLREPRLLPFGVSVPVFSSGESQTGFHRESLQITSILARRKQNLHPAGSTPLFLPLLSFPNSIPPSCFPSSLS